MKQYYAVYSVRSKAGSGFGRSTFEATGEIKTMADIQNVEAELLKQCQEKEPDAGYSNLFLINWREIADARC